MRTESVLCEQLTELFLVSNAKHNNKNTRQLNIILIHFNRVIFRPTLFPLSFHLHPELPNFLFRWNFQQNKYLWISCLLLKAQLDGGWLGSFYVITDVIDKEPYSAWSGAACWIAAEAVFSRSSKGLGAGSWLRVAREQHDYTTRYSTSRADLLAEQVTSRHSTSRAPYSWALTCCIWH
jgi:hypothetical protein